LKFEFELKLLIFPTSLRSALKRPSEIKLNLAMGSQNELYGFTSIPSF